MFCEKATEKLIKAVASHDVKKAEKWLKKGGDPNYVYKSCCSYYNYGLEYSATVFTEACKFQGLSMVRLLYSYGGKINPENEEVESALVHACTNTCEEQLAIIEFLLDKGADINCGKSQSPIAMLCRIGNHSECDRKQQNRAAKALELMLDKGASIEYSIKNEFDWLYTCGEYMNLPCAKILIARGMDVNLLSRFKTDEGKDIFLSPLFALIYNIEEELLSDTDYKKDLFAYIELLLKNGADLNFKDHKNRSITDIAVKNNMDFLFDVFNRTIS